MKINNDLLPIVVSASEPIGSNRKKIWKRHSKNLLDLSLARLGSYHGLTITYDSSKKCLVLNGTTTDTVDIYIYDINSRNPNLIQYMNNKKGKFTLSNNLGLINYLRGASSGYNQDTINITDDNLTTMGFMRVGAGKTFSNTELYAMLESGDKQTSYEHYINDAEYILNENNIYELFSNNEDTGWVSLKVPVDGLAKYRKIGNMVFIYCSVKPTQNYQAVVQNLPSNILPPQNLQRYAIRHDSNNQGRMVLNISDQNIWFILGDTNYYYNLDFCYIVD